MFLKQKFIQDLKEALRGKDDLRINVLGMLLAGIGNKEIELMKKESGLSEEEASAVLRKEIKNRNKAIEAFEKGGRQDLARKEKTEKEILEKYLVQE